MRILFVLAMSGLLLAACGGVDAPDSLARTDATTTTSIVPTTTPEPLFTMPEDPSSIEFSDEDLAALSVILDTPEGRKLVADGLVAETEMTMEQAGCFVEEVELASILSLAGGAPLADDIHSDVLIAFDTCDIDIAIFEGMSVTKRP